MSRARIPAALLVLAAAVAAQGAATVPELVGDLCGRDVERRNRAFWSLVGHADRPAVVEGLRKVLTNRVENEWKTAVGLGGGGARRKVVQALAEPEHAVETEPPRAPTRWIRDDLDLAYEDWQPRALAAAALGCIGPDARPAMDDLVHAAGWIGEYDLVANAAWALTQLGPECATALTRVRSLSARRLADILTGYEPATLGVGGVAELIAARHLTEAELGCRLAGGWRLGDDVVRSALVEAAHRRPIQSAAVSALLAIGRPGVADLLELMRHADPDVAQAAAAAFVPLLGGGLTAADPELAIVEEALVSVALRDAAGIDTVHAALRALAHVTLAEAHRKPLRAAVISWCRHPDGRRRLLGFRHLGVFGRSEEDHELVAGGLRDEFDNVVSEAAMAAARVAAPRTPEILQRWLQAWDPRAEGLLLQLLADDPRAGKDALTKAAQKIVSRSLDVLLAGASGDDATVLALGADAGFPGLAAKVLYSTGPMTTARWRRLDELSGSSAARLHVLMLLQQQAPDRPVDLDVLFRAVRSGVGDEAVEVLARVPSADLVPHREALRAVLQSRSHRVRALAADLLRKLPR